MEHENYQTRLTEVATIGAISTFPKRLRAQILPPSHLTREDESSLYLLMREYYANISEEKFFSDLREKNDIILLRDLTGSIRGFSTLLVKTVMGSNGPVRTVFSGDTVVDRDYWGQKELGVAFLKYLFLQKLERPLDPLYWMLMSKGYKTYLLMANNFRVHYPRFESRTPASVQSVLDTFYGDKFGSAYDARTGLISPQGADCRLREGVAAVTDELRAKLKRVDFFAERNPRWSDGVELACIAEMTLQMPLYYLLKKTVFRFFKFRRS